MPAGGRGGGSWQLERRHSAFRYHRWAAWPAAARTGLYMAGRHCSIAVVGAPTPPNVRLCPSPRPKPNSQAINQDYFSPSSLTPLQSKLQWNEQTVVNLRGQKSDIPVCWCGRMSLRGRGGRHPAGRHALHCKAAKQWRRQRALTRHHTIWDVITRRRWHPVTSWWHLPGSLDVKKGDTRSISPFPQPPPARS